MKVLFTITQIEGDVVAGVAESVLLTKDGATVFTSGHDIGWNVDAKDISVATVMNSDGVFEIARKVYNE